MQVRQSRSWVGACAGVLTGFVLAGCATLPDLGDPPPASSGSTTYPRLLPVAEVLNVAPASEQADDLQTADFDARMAALRARAAALRAVSVNQ